MCPHSKNHLLVPIHLFTRQIVATFIALRIVDNQESSLNCHKLFIEMIVFTGFSYTPYKVLPSIKNIFTRASFFFVLSFIFIAHFFRGVVGACVNPGKFFSNSLFVHSIIICQMSHSFLNGFQPNLCQHFSHVRMLYLSYYFQSEVKLIMYIK